MTRSPASAAPLSVLLCVRAFSAAPHQGDTTESEPRCDPATVIDVTGTVISTREVPPGKPLGGLHLLIGTDAGEVDIFLEPVDFLKEFEISFSPGNATQIIGARVPFGGGHVVLAREVRKGEVYLYLRDNSGHPNWPARRSPTA